LDTTLNHLVVQELNFSASYWKSVAISINFYNLNATPAMLCSSI